MGDWPARLGPGDARAFNASLVVPDGPKRVWMEQYVLDTKGLGCWLTHEQLGARLGMTARSVESHRLRLEDAGCMKRLKEAGQRAHGWRSTIPDHCQMRSQRPTPAEVEKHRTFIDRHVGTWPPKPATDVVESRSRRVQDPQSASSKPAPVRVSDVLSTAFDSQADSKPSSALDVEGSRVREKQEGRKAVEGDLPQSVLHRKSKSDSLADLAHGHDLRDPALVRAEGMALIRLTKGERLNPADQALVRGWLERHPDKRKAMGL